ncbi:L-rhamnose mutarotase [Microbacterium insulae]|uniref:L-rhamnose mutarotase n=1 Tax=Microbacterium insulae TaxID=483014 RepID=A0ABW3AG61_9MICO
MNRYCFQLRVAPAHLDEYRRRHAAVWPEMLRALRDSGWSNYSLFLRPDGLLIGYFESEHEFETVQSAMAATDVNARWQAEMARLFEGLDGTPDTGLLLLDEIFHLEDQLADADASGAEGDSS